MRRYLFPMLALLGCSAERPAVLATDSAPWRKPGDHVDSIFPMPELLRRFRADVPAVTAFAGGERSREALARRFLLALEARDTAALLELVVSKAEFAWLLFPEHLYHDPPYEMDPGLFWSRLAASTGTGAARLLDRQGGRRLTMQALTCARDTLQFPKDGPVTLFDDCRLRFRQDDSTITRKLFGAIVARDGRMKFLSYSNDY